MQGRITKEFVMRPYVFTTQLRRIIIMKKRLIVVLMCAAMVTVLGAGCGSKKEDTKEQKQELKNVKKELRFSFQASPHRRLRRG